MRTFHGSCDNRMQQPAATKTSDLVNDSNIPAVENVPFFQIQGLFEKS